MYVGHSLLAFALAGTLAAWYGTSGRRALTVAVLAGGFALVPDTDLAYTVYTVIRAGPSNVFPTTRYVWTESWVVHRAMTHSLLVGVVAVGLVLAVAKAYAKRRERVRASLGDLLPAAALLVLLAAAGFGTDGGLGLLTMDLYLLAAVAITILGVRRGAAPTETAGAAAIGFLTHPFGDVFMGTPPTFLYPLRSTTPIDVVVVSPDPTANLLALFGLELLLGWAALTTYTSLTGRSLLISVEPHALLGVGFAGAAFFLRPPTLDVAYHFALSVLGVGLVIGIVPSAVTLEGDVRRNADAVLSALATGLAAVTLAVIGYFVAYQFV